MEMAPELGCPRCHAPLAARAEGLTCATHGVVGERAANGFLQFEDASDYWGEVERDLMRRINAVASTQGWREALEQELLPVHPELMNYVQDSSRADWRVLLPLDRERTVSVDVGAGWGANSFAVADQVLRHYAVEKIEERIRFLEIRRQDDGIANLIPIRADLHALPFSRASIDVFIVNGVLEWAGLVDPAAAQGVRPRSPMQLQEHFLRQLLELLRPGGWLYVGIENRFGRMFLRGTPDHQGLRFTSLMPRRIARAYTHMRAARSPRTFEHERDYRAWTYSLRGYRQLFERCGFTQLQCYAVVPGYNVPTQLVPLDSPGPFLYLASRMRSPRRLLGRVRRVARWLSIRAGFEKSIASCYAFIVRRPEESTR